MTKTVKLPAFQFYPADWRKDPGVQALNYEERGVWLELLLLMHESDQRGKLMLNGKSISPERLSQILHLDKQKVTTLITTFLELGVASLDPAGSGALINRRMLRDEVLIQKRRSAGRLGGNPLFKKGTENPYHKQEDNHPVNHEVNQVDKQNDKHPHKHRDKQKITPSSSASALKTTHARESVVDNSVASTAKRAAPWWLSAKATKAKGEAIGLKANPGESMEQYRARIRAALPAGQPTNEKGVTS